MLSTQMDGDPLKPRFLEQLRVMRQHCGTPAERERCDRLAASLRLTARLGPEPPQQRRPRTAMAAPGCGSGWDPYETTMSREYPLKASTPINGECPKSSKGYRYPYQIDDPIGCTLYSDEFCWKPYSKPDPIRAATSSGARNHKPHPSKAFTTWRLPREELNIAMDSRSPWSKPPTLEEAQKVLKAQFSSIYKRDYLGIPQGFQVKHAFSTPPDWKKQIPHTLNTEFRYHYQIPHQIPKFVEPDFKYGCYSNLNCAAQGVVPTVSVAHIKNQENRKQLTTYQRHFGKDYVDLQMVLNSLDPEEVEKYLRSVPKEERKVLQQFLKAAVRKEENSTSFASQSKQCDYHQKSQAPACPFN